METNKPSNIDDYISGFPKETRDILGQVRQTIRKTAPEAEEAISYAMPTFKLNKANLVHFAAYKNHIGFYALPSGHMQFQKQLSAYKSGKGSVQFPLSEPIPWNLIAQIVTFRAREASQKPKKK